MGVWAREARLTDLGKGMVTVSTILKRPWEGGGG